MKHQLTLSSLLFVILATVIAPALSLPIIGDNMGDLVIPSNEASSEMSRRGQLENRILSSTVRVYFQTWVVASGEAGYMMFDSVSHATVKDGRYLVTHNHTEIPLSIRVRAGEPESYTQIFLYNAAGELRHKGPLSDFSIAVEDAETLVLAHREEAYLESLGFTSAEFKSRQLLGLEDGMEVAQIDWDGEKTRVDWAIVNDIAIEVGVPRITLAEGATVGASGGGIFWRGNHIANNWLVEEKLNYAGEVIEQATTAALNSGSVVN